MEEQPVVNKPKRVMTEAQLEQLARARAKAIEVRRKMAEERRRAPPPPPVESPESTESEETEEEEDEEEEEPPRPDLSALKTKYREKYRAKYYRPPPKSPPPLRQAAQDVVRQSVDREMARMVYTSMFPTAGNLPF